MMIAIQRESAFAAMQNEIASFSTVAVNQR